MAELYLKHRTLGTVVMVLGGISGHSIASPADDNLVLAASLEVKRDDNLFRLPDAQIVPMGRSDTITTPEVALGFRQSISRQQLSADATVFAPRYQQHEALNHSGYRLQAAWTGEVGRNWLPELDYQKSYDLSSYEDVMGGVMDMLHQQRIGTGLTYGNEGRASIGADGWWEQKRHGSGAYQSLDLDETGVGIEGRFDSAAGIRSTLRLDTRWIGYREAQSEQFNYRLDKLRAGVRWPLGNKLTLSADAGYMMWSFDVDDSTQSDWLASTGLTWKPTEKLELSLNYSRDSEDPGYNQSVSIAERSELNAFWQMGERWRLHGMVSREWSRYGSDAAPVREDINFAYLAELQWQISDSVSTQLYWRQGNRNSNQSSTDFDYQLIGLAIKYTF